MNPRALVFIFLMLTMSVNASLFHNASVGPSGMRSGGVEAPIVDHREPVTKKPSTARVAAIAKAPDAGATASSARPDRPPGVLPPPSIERSLKLVVGIRYKQHNGSLGWCSGEMIDKDAVLTAAHCTCGILRSYRVFTLYDMQESKAKDKDGFLLMGSPILFRPGINPCGDDYRPNGKDIALLKVNFSPKGERPFCGEKASCLDGFNHDVWELRTELKRGKDLTVVGYGLNNDGKYGERFEGLVPILSPFCLEQRFGQVCAGFAEMILAAPQSDDDTCGGDSGGAVFLRRGDENILVAITSRGLPGMGTECGAGGVYTLLGRRSVREWLAANGVRTVLRN